MTKLTKNSVLLVALSITVLWIGWQLLYAQAAQQGRSHNEIIRTIAKQPYAPDVPTLKQMHHFKTAQEINAGGNFSLTNKLPEWDQKIKEIETTLQEIDTIRKRFNNPFEQKKAIKKDIEEINVSIAKLDPTDLTQFTQLTSEKQRLELELNDLEITIEKEVTPKIELLQEKYNKLETELFQLFNQIAKEK